MSDRALQLAHRSLRNPTFTDSADALTPLPSAALIAEDSMALHLAATDGTASAQALFGPGDAAPPSAVSVVPKPTASPTFVALLKDEPVSYPLATLNGSTKATDAPTTTVPAPLPPAKVPDLVVVAHAPENGKAGVTHATPKQEKVEQKDGKKTKKVEKEKKKKSGKHKHAKKNDKSESSSEDEKPVKKEKKTTKEKKHKKKKSKKSKSSESESSSESGSQSDEGEDASGDSDDLEEDNHEKVDPDEIKELEEQGKRVDELIARKTSHQRELEEQISAVTDFEALEEARIANHKHKSHDKAQVAASAYAKSASEVMETTRGKPKRTAARLADTLNAATNFLTLVAASKTKSDTKRALEHKAHAKERQRLLREGKEAPSLSDSDDIAISLSDEAEVVDDVSGDDDQSDDDDIEMDPELADFIVPDKKKKKKKKHKKNHKHKKTDASSDEDDSDDSSSSENAEPDPAAIKALNKQLKNNPALQSSAESSSSDDDEATTELLPSAAQVTTTFLDHATFASLTDMMDIDTPGSAAATSVPSANAPDPLLDGVAREDKEEVMDFEMLSPEGNVSAFNFGSTSYGRIALKVPEIFVPRITPTREQAAVIVAPESAVVATMFKNDVETDAAFAADARTAAMAIACATYRLIPALAPHIDKAFAVARARALGTAEPSLPSNITQRAFVVAIADMLAGGAAETRNAIDHARKAATCVDTPMRRLVQAVMTAKHIAFLYQGIVPVEADNLFFCPFVNRPIRAGERIDYYRIVQHGPWESGAWKDPRPWEHPSMKDYVKTVITLSDHPFAMGVPLPRLSDVENAALSAEKPDHKRKERAAPVVASPVPVTLQSVEPAPKKQRTEEAAAPQVPPAFVPIDYEVQLRPARDHPYEGPLVLKVNDFWRHLHAERLKVRAPPAPIVSDENIMEALFSGEPEKTIPSTIQEVGTNGAVDAMNKFRAETQNVHDLKTLGAAFNVFSNESTIPALAVLLQLTGRPSAAAQAELDRIDDVFGLRTTTLALHDKPNSTGINLGLIGLALYAAQATRKRGASSTGISLIFANTEALATTWDPQNELWKKFATPVLALFDAAFPLE